MLPHDKIATAEKLVERREYDAAIKHYNTLARDTDFSAEAYQYFIRNRLAYIAVRLRDFNAAEKWLTASTQFAKNLIDSLVTDNLLLKGDLAYAKGDFEKALAWADEALERLMTKPGQPLKKAQCHHLIGNIYAHGFFRLSLGLDHYKKSLPVFERNGPRAWLAALQFDMARAYQNKSELQTALVYLDEAEAFYATDRRYLPDLADCKNLRGIHYFTTGEYDKYFSLQQQAIDMVSPAKGIARYHLGKYYDNYGAGLQILGRCNGSLDYFRKGLIENLKWSFNEYRITNSYLNLGEYYKDCEQHYDSAKHYLKKSLQVRRKEFGEKHSETSAAYMHLGSLFDRLGNRDSALVYFQYALTSEIPEFNSSDIAINPEAYGSGYSFNTPYILYYKALSLYARYQEKKNPGDLVLAFGTLCRADSLVSMYRTEFFWEESRVSFSATLKVLYESAMHYGWALYQKTKDRRYAGRVFALMESSRYNVLLENIRDAQRSGDNPAVGYKKQIAINALKLAGEKQKPQPDVGKIKSIESGIQETRRLLQQHYNNTKRDPARQAGAMADLDACASYLAKNNARLLEFFWGDSALYCLDVDAQGNVDLRRTDLVHIAKKLLETQRQISRPPDMAAFAKERDTFVDNATFLYQQFFGDKPSGKNSNLIIVPDGPLTFFPFEALIAGKADKPCGGYHCLPFLARDHTVYYSFSFSILQLLSATQPQAEKSVLALYASKYKSLPALAGAQREVDRIETYFTVTRPDTTSSVKQQFLIQSSRYDVLHLAVHGKADTENGLNSFVAFGGDSSEWLYAHELYDLKLTASLVMLTACETASGKIEKGEGMFSLGRAFMMAGSRSVVSSLWKIPDQASSQIVADFYKHMAGGSSAPSALQLAKVDYLSTHDEITTHPYYWSALNYMGGPSAASENIPIYFYLIGVAGMAMIAFIWMRRARR